MAVRIRSSRHRAPALVAGIATLALLGGCADAAPTSEEQPTPTVLPSTAESGLTVVAIGDSIPYNSPDDCSGCTGFVDRYAESAAAATGQAVEVRNLTQHTGLTLPGLIDALDSLADPLAEADIILVGIAHNSFELSSDTPCGAPLIDDMPDWSRIDDACATAAATTYAPQYDELFSRVAASRAGEPTALRTINRYNDWIGWAEGGLTPEQEAKSATLLDAWNDMLCTAAEEHGFVCVDVYHEFNGPDGRTAAGDLLASDYTHPSDRGNEVIAEALTAEGFAPFA